MTGATGQGAIAARFWALAGGWWTAPESRRRALGLGAGLLCLNGAEVALFLRFSTWNRDLFDALERRDAAVVLAEFGVLAAIVVGFCGIAWAQMRVRRALALGWRDYLAGRLTLAWGAAGSGIANADGRIAEDARVATEEAVELAASLSHAVITLACFISVLWALSAHPPVSLGGVVWAVPGYLLWVALAYAVAGTGIALLAGRPLTRATDLRQAMEADYRAALVQAADRGGPDRAGVRRLDGLFAALAEAFARQSRAYARLELFACGITRFGLGLPYLVATPAYLAGVVTLGWVMQAAQAFQMVAGALGWPVAYMPRLAIWRASAERVVALAATAPEALRAPETATPAALAEGARP